MSNCEKRLELAAKVKAFTESCEVVSLGCHGVVTRSLEVLGLRRFQYPFDDTRSSMDDVIQLVETSFTHFLDSVTTDESVQGTGIDEPVSAHKEDMRICIDRFLGRREEVPLGKPRIFVRAVNSSTEVAHAERLHEALRCALPKARVYLLVLLDCQSTAGPVHFADTSDDLLFYRIPERSPAACRDRFECVRDMYGAAIAFAFRFWSSCASDLDDLVVEVATICDAAWIFDEFSGGDSGTRFLPRRSSVRWCATKASSVWPSENEGTQGCGCVASLVTVPQSLLSRLSHTDSSKQQLGHWSRFRDDDHF